MRKGKKEKGVINGWHYFSTAMLVFLGLGLEFFIVEIDKLLFPGFQIQTRLESPWYVSPAHHTMTIIVWGIVIFLACKWIMKHGKLEEIFNMKWNKDTLKFMAFALIAAVLFSWLELAMENKGFALQIVREYKRMESAYGSYAIIVSLFQNIYYVVEAMLVTLLVALMQKAGEEIFHFEKFPYGGVGLMFTWGIGHFTKGVPAMLWIIGMSFVVGGMLVLSKKNIWASYLFILCIFII